MDKATGKIFMNGSSQAVRLPKEFRFDCDEVYLHKDGDKVILSPRPPNWDDFFRQESAFDATFMEDRDDSPPQYRDER